MEQKEMDQLLEKVGNEAAASVKSALVERDTKIAELETKAAKVDQLDEALRTQGDIINDLKNNSTQYTKAKKTVREQLKEGLTSEDAKSKYDEIKKGTATLLTLKVAGTMTNANIIPVIAGAAQLSLTSFDPNLNLIRRRSPYLRQIMNTEYTSDLTAAWIEQTNVQGGAGGTLEGALKNQLSWDEAEKKMDAQKITAFTKVSTERLADDVYMARTIDQLLRKDVELKLDDHLLSGTGTAPQLKGIQTYAPSFDVTGTPFALGIVVPNQFDVIRAAVGLIASKNFAANYVIINPLDAAMMDMVKAGTTNGVYVFPPFATADGQTIAGLTVIENNGIAVGSFLVGDFSYSNCLIREDINVSIGLDMDDFTKNLVTVRAETRAVHFVKGNDLNAFVKGTFATAITAIKAP